MAYRLIKSAKLSVFLAAGFIVIFTNCATSISYQTTRLPPWNTANIKSIAVIPFETSDNTALQRQAANWLNATIYSQVQSTNHFILYSPDKSASADAVFTGKVHYTVVNDSTQTETRFDQKTGTETEYLLFERTVKLSFMYTLTDNNGIIIGLNTIEDSLTDSSEIKAEEEESDTRQSGRRRTDTKADDRINEYLKTPEVMVQEMITKNMRNLSRNMVPYIVTEKRSLLKEPSKDKKTKQRSSDAMFLVKGKNYEAAQNIFSEIYTDTKSYEAAFNACLLMMSQNQFDEALLFMQTVYEETGDKRAAAEINNIQKIIDNKNLAANYRN